MTDYHDSGSTGCGVTVIGTCSLCGGQVATPTAWGGTDPPRFCQGCGAEAIAGALTVIPTELPVRGLVIGGEPGDPPPDWSSWHTGRPWWGE